MELSSETDDVSSRVSGAITGATIGTLSLLVLVKACKNEEMPFSLLGNFSGAFVEVIIMTLSLMSCLLPDGSFPLPEDAALLVLSEDVLLVDEAFLALIFACSFAQRFKDGELDSNMTRS